MTPEQRGKYLNKLADLFDENADLLAAVESLDNGKAITMAKGDVGACSGCLRYYGGWADKIEGKVIDTDPGTFNYTKKEPVSLSYTRCGRCSKLIQRPDRCVRSDYPLELPTPHVVVEDRPSHRNR